MKSMDEIYEEIDMEEIRQRGFPSLCYSHFNRGRCSPLCDGHCWECEHLTEAERQESIEIALSHSPTDGEKK